MFAKLFLKFVDQSLNANKMPLDADSARNFTKLPMDTKHTWLLCNGGHAHVGNTVP